MANGHDSRDPEAEAAIHEAHRIFAARRRQSADTVPNPRMPENNPYGFLPIVAGVVTLVGTGLLFMGADTHFFNGFIDHNFLPKLEPFAEIGIAGAGPGYGMYRLTKAALRR